MSTKYKFRLVSPISPLLFSRVFSGALPPLPSFRSWLFSFFFEKGFYQELKPASESPGLAYQNLERYTPRKAQWLPMLGLASSPLNIHCAAEGEYSPTRQRNNAHIIEQLWWLSELQAIKPPTVSQSRSYRHSLNFGSTRPLFSLLIRVTICPCLSVTEGFLGTRMISDKFTQFGQD